MVVHSRCSESRHKGWLQVDLMVAIALLAAVVTPLSVTFIADQRAMRVAYWRCIAMEIVDSEAEVLTAGGWRKFASGTNTLQVRARAATNLPSGRFQVVIELPKVQVSWKPFPPSRAISILRELEIRP